MIRNEGRLGPLEHSQRSVPISITRVCSYCPPPVIFAGADEDAKLATCPCLLATVPACVNTAPARGLIQPITVRPIGKKKYMMLRLSGPRAQNSLGGVGIDAALRGAVEREDVPGLVAVVTDRRRVLYQGAFGAAEALPFHAIAALPPKRLLAAFQ
jgi:hypothetical protein